MVQNHVTQNADPLRAILSCNVVPRTSLRVVLHPHDPTAPGAEVPGSEELSKFKGEEP